MKCSLYLSNLSKKKCSKIMQRLYLSTKTLLGGLLLYIHYSALISLIYLILGSRSFQQWESLAPAPIDVSVVNLLLDNQPTVKVKIFFVNKGNFHYVNFVPCLCCRNLKVTFIEKLLLKIFHWQMEKQGYLRQFCS